MAAVRGRRADSPEPGDLAPLAARVWLVIVVLSLALWYLARGGGAPAVAHSLAVMAHLPSPSATPPATPSPTPTGSDSASPTGTATGLGSASPPMMASALPAAAALAPGEQGFVLLTGYYGRFSNNMMQVAELVGLALLLNRTVVLPSGPGARFGGLEAFLDLPSLDAAGVRRVSAKDAAAACPSLAAVYLVAGGMFNGEQPAFDALPAGVAPPAARVSLNGLRAAAPAGWVPDDGGPAVAASAAARGDVWHTYPYPLLIDAPSARRWTGSPTDGIVVPSLVAELRALAPPPRCLALDSTFYVLDWRPVPALFRRVFGALLAPTPGTAAAVARARAGVLGGAPYAALHLRMTDFCIRPEDAAAGGCAPGGFGRWLAPTLAAMLAAPACAAGAAQLLVLTDDPGSTWMGEVRAAAAAAGAAVRAVTAADAAGAAADADAAVILLEQTLAAGAECFMGAAASTFSALIRARRDVAGADWETFMPFQYEV